MKLLILVFTIKAATLDGWQDHGIHTLLMTFSVFRGEDLQIFVLLKC